MITLGAGKGKTPIFPILIIIFQKLDAQKYNLFLVSKSAISSKSDSSISFAVPDWLLKSMSTMETISNKSKTNSLSLQLIKLINS